MRALIDDGFLDIDIEKVRSPRLRKAAALINDASDLLQEKALKGLSDLYAHSNVGPKPDIKKPLISLGKILWSHAGKMNIGQTAVLTLGFGVIAVATHMAHHSTNGSILSDVMSTYLGAKPNAGITPAHDL